MGPGINPGTQGTWDSRQALCTGGAACRLRRGRALWGIAKSRQSKAIFQKPLPCHT